MTHVYVMNTGEFYHKIKNCQWLKFGYDIPLAEAENDYKPCVFCYPIAETQGSPKIDDENTKSDLLENEYDQSAKDDLIEEEESDESTKSYFIEEEEYDD